MLCWLGSVAPTLVTIFPIFILSHNTILFVDAECDLLLKPEPDSDKLYFCLGVTICVTDRFYKVLKLCIYRQDGMSE